jgi:hypothetical protein
MRADQWMTAYEAKKETGINAAELFRRALLGEVRYRADGKALSFASADVRKLGGLAPDEAGPEAPRDAPPPKWVRAVVVRRQLGWGAVRVAKAGLRGAIRTQTVGKAISYHSGDVERILADLREADEFAAQHGGPLAKRR